MLVNHRAGGWAPKALKTPAGPTQHDQFRMRGEAACGWTKLFYSSVIWNYEISQSHTQFPSSFTHFQRYCFWCYCPTVPKVHLTTEMSYARFPAGMSQVVPSHTWCTIKDTKTHSNVMSWGLQSVSVEGSTLQRTILLNYFVDIQKKIYSTEDRNIYLELCICHSFPCNYSKWGLEFSRLFKIFEWKTGTPLLNTGN